MGRAVRIAHNSDSNFSPTEIAQRARSRVGENQYHILKNNCEHFCHWCRTGRSRSSQVEGPLLIAVRTFAAVVFLAKPLRWIFRASCKILGRGIPASVGASLLLENAQ
jgi:hypothetical protein